MPTQKSLENIYLSVLIPLRSESLGWAIYDCPTERIDWQAASRRHNRFFQFFPPDPTASHKDPCHDIGRCDNPAFPLVRRRGRYHSFVPRNGVRVDQLSNARRNDQVKDDLVNRDRCGLAVCDDNDRRRTIRPRTAGHGEREHDGLHHDARRPRPVAFILNSGLVSHFFAAKTNKRVMSVWTDYCLNALVMYLSGALLAGFTNKAIRRSILFSSSPYACFSRRSTSPTGATSKI